MFFRKYRTLIPFLFRLLDNWSLDFANRQDFANYADICFKEFGDRVKHWITLNEPLSFTVGGYANGGGPPSRCSKGLNPNCKAGDSGREPYLVSHYQILAHAAAVKVYREKYQVIALLWFLQSYKSQVRFHFSWTMQFG